MCQKNNRGARKAKSQMHHIQKKRKGRKRKEVEKEKKFQFILLIAIDASKDTYRGLKKIMMMNLKIKNAKTFVNKFNIAS